MVSSIDTELRKVTAVTTLCHLCTLDRLEMLVEEMKKEKYAKPKNKRKYERKNNPGNDC